MEANRHSANLDLLRAFAVSAVLIDHLLATLTTRTAFHHGRGFAFTTNLGHAGVIAFFVHTSLVLMYSLERMSRNPGRITLRFYVRRIFRIYPLAIFAIVLALVFHVPPDLWNKPVPVTAQVIVSNLLLMQNLSGASYILSPLWTLPYELQMYLALPALYFLTRQLRAVTYLSALLAVFCAVGFMVTSKYKAHFLLAGFVPCFLCGVLCYALRDKIKPRAPAVLWPAYVFALFAGYCAAVRGLHGNQHIWFDWLFCILLAYGIDGFRPSFMRGLNYVSGKIALYSYGMYLLHIPALYLVFVFLGVGQPLAGALLFLAITILGSAATYAVIEAPFIAVGRVVSSRSFKVAAGVPSAAGRE